MLNVDETMAPDWGLWRDIPTAGLDEAVALSLNVNPLFAQTLWNMFNDLSESDAGPAEFARRLVIARNNIQPLGSLAAFGMNEDPPRCRVRLADFALWAVGFGWELPSMFPAGSAGATCQKVQSSPSLPHDSATSETPEQRGCRLARRRDELKMAGVKGWQKAIASEENLHPKRIAQILKSHDERTTNHAGVPSLFSQLNTIPKSR